jgi:hypothetical protein
MGLGPPVAPVAGYLTAYARCAWRCHATEFPPASILVAPLTRRALRLSVADLHPPRGSGQHRLETCLLEMMVCREGFR